MAATSSASELSKIAPRAAATGGEATVATEVGTSGVAAPRVGTRGTGTTVAAMVVIATKTAATTALMTVMMVVRPRPEATGAAADTIGAAGTCAMKEAGTAAVMAEERAATTSGLPMAAAAVAVAAAAAATMTATVMVRGHETTLPPETGARRGVTEAVGAVRRRELAIAMAGTGEGFFSSGGASFRVEALLFEWWRAVAPDSLVGYEEILIARGSPVNGLVPT